MGRNKMRKYLRKPPEKKNQNKKWHVLYKRAIELAEVRGDEKTLRYLEDNSETPERTLRRINIIGEADLKRKFPEKKD